jgi:RNA polymerase sigma factor (sigma-70 family)
MPRLIRWATGRLPRSARSLVDTEDLIQDSLIKVVRTLDGIRARNPAAFPAYLRQAVLNRLRDEIRRSAVKPDVTALGSAAADSAPDPLAALIGREQAARYEAALARLREEDRALLFLKIELGMNYREMAAVLDKATPDAARMAANRAVIRLAQELGDNATGS